MLFVVTVTYDVGDSKDQTVPVLATMNFKDAIRTALTIERLDFKLSKANHRASVYRLDCDREYPVMYFSNDKNTTNHGLLVFERNLSFERQDGWEERWFNVFGLRPFIHELVNEGMIYDSINLVLSDGELKTYTVDEFVRVTPAL